MTIKLNKGALSNAAGMWNGEHDEGLKSEMYQTTSLHPGNRNVSDPQQMEQSQGIVGKDALIEKRRLD
jgi:hypothetical protein